MPTACVAEVANVASFFAARKKSGMDGHDDLLKSFADAMVSQINGLTTFTVSDASAMTDALRINSPYGEHSSRVQKTIDQRMKNSLNSSGTPASASGQFLKKWQEFLTQSDWDWLKDPKQSWHSKNTKVAERANAMGVTNPDEQALKWLLAILLLAHYESLPSYKEIYQKLQELKACFATERKAFPFERMIVYPDTPHELSEDIYSHAYTGDDVPVSCYVPGLTNIAENHIPLRKNSKLLKQGKPQHDVSFQEAKRELNGCDEPTIKLEHAAGQNSLRVVQRLGASQHDLIAADDDEEEQALKLEYQAKIIRMRLKKRGADSQDTGVKDEITSHPSTLQRERTLTIHTNAARDVTLQSHDHRVPETPPPAAMPLVTRETAEDDSESDDGDEAGLDPYARAAIKALKTRNVVKRASKKTKKTPPKDVPKKNEKKRPATTPEVKRAILKRPAAVKAEPDDVHKSKILTAMPHVTRTGMVCKPVMYNGGIIYTALKSRNFRALKERGNRYSEQSSSWKRQSPSDAWRTVVAAIDNHKRRKR